MVIPNAEALLDIGIALSKEKNIDKLFETIVDAAMDITNCDGGTIYILKNDALHYKLFITKSLGIRRGIGRDEINLPPVPLNGQNDCARAAVSKTPINVADVYAARGDASSGTKKYDKINNYKTVSMLTVPMEDDDGDIIGVLQLINAMDLNGKLIPFAKEYERIIFSLSSQAAISLVNRNYAAEVTELLDSFVRVMSTAIDARSPYNANHTKNMTVYAEKFIGWLNKNGYENFGADRERQLMMSVWLHDIGKLVVPLEVMDKDTRLGAKLERVLSRLLAAKMQIEIDYLKNYIDEDECERKIAEIDRARDIVELSNKAGALSEAELAEIRALGNKKARTPDGEETLLSQDELICLTIKKGTLTDEERKVIEGHVLMTRRMLSQVTFPKKYRSVADWASAHHEFLNGGGYPDGLRADDLPPEVRILTILDIFDAMTARDRPYKPAMPTDKAFEALSDMAVDGQIDGRLLDLFKKSGAWETAG